MTKLNVLDLNVYQGGVHVSDKWLTSLSLGSGQTRNMALDRYSYLLSCSNIFFKLYFVLIVFLGLKILNGLFKIFRFCFGES